MRTTKQNWQPNANLQHLKLRAQFLQKLRHFFAERQILEVDTPLLSQATVTDVHLQSMEVRLCHDPKTYYLQTSPEFAMKRLLAAGSGAIYQICKAFRQDEIGTLHNPEFTMLEWYRPGFDHHQLMDEVTDLLNTCLSTGITERYSYTEIFHTHLDLDPHTVNWEELQKCAAALNISAVAGIDVTDKDIWLQRLLSDYIEPKLGFTAPTFIYDFPVSQAALAKIRPGTPPVAERFELYIQGIEIANGYHELTDAGEQARRFTADLVKREKLNLPLVTVDKHLLAALEYGLPECAGVALGVDRLIMLATKVQRLEQVVSFTFDRA